MPTEAQWKLAARGGNQSHGYKYAGSNTINDVAWYIDNGNYVSSSDQDGIHVVKTKSPNELGLYDMTGNVEEWCSDWYGSSYYSSSPSSNPTGPESGDRRVLRGGSWYNAAGICRVYRRNGDVSDGCYINCGFRLVLLP